jgi:DNA-binding IclR family transcriptional regulator
VFARRSTLPWPLIALFTAGYLAPYLLPTTVGRLDSGLALTATEAGAVGSALLLSSAAAGFLLAARVDRLGPRTLARVGRRLPAHAGALGKALLAERADAELPQGPYEALTPNSHTTRESLLTDLAETRSRGYSIDHEEGVLGIVGFGFALRYDSPVQDAISCSVPVARLTPDHEQQIITVMREIRGKIEATAPGAGGAPSWR